MNVGDPDSSSSPRDARRRPWRDVDVELEVAVVEQPTGANVFALPPDQKRPCGVEHRNRRDSPRNGRTLGEPDEIVAVKGGQCKGADVRIANEAGRGGCDAWVKGRCVSTKRRDAFLLRRLIPAGVKLLPCQG